MIGLADTMESWGLELPRRIRTARPHPGGMTSIGQAAVIRPMWRYALRSATKPRP
jgi:hypothetical protein